VDAKWFIEVLITKEEKEVPKFPFLRTDRRVFFPLLMVTRDYPWQSNERPRLNVLGPDGGFIPIFEE